MKNKLTDEQIESMAYEDAEVLLDKLGLLKALLVLFLFFGYFGLMAYLMFGEHEPLLP